MPLPGLDCFEKFESVELLIEFLAVRCDPNGDENAGAGGLATGFGAKGFDAGFGAKGLYGEVLGDPKGDAVAIGFGAKGFVIAGAAAKGFGFGSVGSRRTVLSFCPPPREGPLPPRPVSIVPF
jgi:hypothetical protein